MKSPFFLPVAALVFTLTVLLFQPVFGQQSRLQELERQLQNAVQAQDQGKAAYYSYQIGKLYKAQEQPDLSLSSLSDAISYGKKAGDDMLTYLAYQLTGSILAESKDYNKALNNYQRALKLAQQMNKSEFIMEGLIDVAVSYALTGKHKRSIAPLDEALSIAIRQKDVLTQQRCYELLAEYHKMLGNNAKTTEYQTLFNNLVRNQEKEELTQQQLKELEQQIEQAGSERRTTRHRLLHESRKLRQAEDSLLSTKYSLEETEESLRIAQAISENQQLQIDLLNMDKRLAEMRIKEQKARLRNEALIRNFILAGTLLVVGFVFMVIRGYRKQVAANKQIARQNENIKSSINYAKRIQEAMLHKSDLSENQLPNSFVLFRPRDSVSGDFYWVSELKNWYDPDVVIAAVDCTGHGIPGAFMSMIGINALNTIIGQGIAESDQILNALDKEIRSALQQETTGNKDGMDVALCIYRKEKGILEFSGAKNPLVYIQDGALTQVKGDVHPIGGNKPKGTFSFKKHNIPIDEPTTIYLYSDGFQDQFGGEKNTKFMSKHFKSLLLEIHDKPMPEQKAILEQTLNEWMDGQKQTDDILVMGIRLEGEWDE